MDGSGEEQLCRSAESESEGEFDQVDRELDELYSESDSEHYAESDLDHDDRISARDDASDDLSDIDGSERGFAFDGDSGACPDLGGLL